MKFNEFPASHPSEYSGRIVTYLAVTSQQTILPLPLTASTELAQNPRVILQGVHSI
jgi:hypothetical protein